MGILDTFFLIYDADASKAEKELEKIEKKGKDVAEELTHVDKTAEKMGQSIGRGLAQLGSAIAGVFAMRALSASFMEAVTHADKLDETAQRLDISVETLSVWGDAAKEAGGSLGGLIASVESFNGMLAAMEVTGKSRAAPFLKELGIDMDNVANKGKNAFDLLPEIAKAMEGMGKQESMAIGKKLGLDAGTIMLLQQGGRELDAMLAKHKALGAVTKEQGEIAAKFNDQIDDSTHALRSLWLQASTYVLPILTWLGKKVEEVTQFMREHGDFVVGVMIAIGSAIAVFAIPPLLAMAAATLVALAPFILIGAAIAAIGAAFALVYDDIMNFIDGNDSLIGQFLESYPQIAAIIYGIGDVFKWLVSVVSDVLSIIQAAFSLVFEAISTIVVGIFKYWADQLSIVGQFFSALGQVVSGIFQYWIELIGQFLDKFGGIVGIAKAVGGAISGALGAAKGALGISTAPKPGEPGSGKNAAGQRVSEEGAATGKPGAYGVPGMAQGKEQLSAAGSAPLAATSSTAIQNKAVTQNKNTQVTTGPITVQTQATDAAGIASGIGKALKDQMRGASDEFNDGVAA